MSIKIALTQLLARLIRTIPAGDIEEAVKRAKLSNFAADTIEIPAPELVTLVHRWADDLIGEQPELATSLERRVALLFCYLQDQIMGLAAYDRISHMSDSTVTKELGAYLKRNPALYRSGVEYAGLLYGPDYQPNKSNNEDE